MKIAILTSILDRAERKSGVPLYGYRLIDLFAEHSSKEDSLYLIHCEESEDLIYEEGEEVMLSSSLPTLFKELYIIFFKLPRALEEKDIDVLHVISPTFPELLALFLSDSKKVLTIHDASMLTNNLCPWKRFRRRAIRKIRKFTLKLVRNKVDKFIAVSKSIKQNLIEQLKIKERKVKVVYEAPTEVFRSMEIKTSGFNSPFILTHPPRVEVVEVFSNLIEKGLDYKLVIFGWISKEERREIERKIDDLSLEQRIHFTGHLSREKVAKLYNTAELFIAYNEYEGFGLTPLEAMACKCPVVAPDAGAVPEITGGNAELADPYQLEEWVEKSYHILTDEDFRRKLIERGSRWVEKFSWERAVKDTLEIYKEALNYQDEDTNQRN